MSDKIENRNRTVLEAALAVSKDKGWHALTRDGVAERAGVAAGSVNNAFGTMDGLRDAVMGYAVALVHACKVDGYSHDKPVYDDMVAIVSSGLAAGHDAVRNAHPDVRAEAVAHLTAAA